MTPNNTTFTCKCGSKDISLVEIRASLPERKIEGQAIIQCNKCLTRDYIKKVDDIQVYLK